MKNTVTKHVHTWIAAPDLPAALALELRLADLNPSRSKRGDRWLVEATGPISARGPELIVARWLEQIGERGTTIRIDDDLVHVDATSRGRHLATNRNFIG